MKRKPLRKLRTNDKTREKKRDKNKVISQKKVQSYRKKRKRRKSASSREAILKRKLQSLLSLPLAAGNSNQTFALVPITDTQIAEAFRMIAKREKAESRRAKANPDSAFGWNSYEEPINEQVEQLFAFRVEPGDVNVKPEVWAKIIRTLPENFVIPDPELTSFFDNLNPMQPEGDQMMFPQMTGEPDTQSVQIREPEYESSPENGSTQYP